MRNTSKKRGRGLHAFFLFFVIPTFLAKQNMSSNRVEGEIIEQAREWDNHTIMTQVYEGANVIYFLG
jgi:hypothetical protein